MFNFFYLQELVIWALAGLSSPGFSLTFSLYAGIVNKLLKTAIKKRKTIIKLLCLARTKLSNIESKISKALINNEISYEDFMTIIIEKIIES